MHASQLQRVMYSTPGAVGVMTTPLLPCAKFPCHPNYFKLVIVR